MKVYLPWLGEFGTELMYWVPWVHAREENKIVCFEEGKEPIYPYDFFVKIPRIPEEFRGSSASGRQGEIFEMIKRDLGPDYEYVEPRRRIGGTSYFTPETDRDYGFECDVCLFPRFRSKIGIRKNWDGWARLANMLKAEGLKVFAAGHPDMSYGLDCPGCRDYPTEQALHATIWAINHSRIRVGVITGLTILALFCGRRPWVLTTKDGYAGVFGKDGPNQGHLKRSDFHKVGWDMVPLLDDINGLRDRILEELKR